VKFLSHVFGIQTLLDVFEIHPDEDILQWLECSFFIGKILRCVIPVVFVQ